MKKINYTSVAKALEKELRSELGAKDFFKENRHSMNEAWAKNLYYFDSSWKKLTSEKFSSISIRVFERFSIHNFSDQNIVVKLCLEKFSFPFENINIDGDKILVVGDKVILLEKIENRKYKDVRALWRDKQTWLRPHFEFMQNHLLNSATVKIPEFLNFKKFNSAMYQFHSILKESLGDREDTYQWLMNEFARHLCRYSNDQGFVHFVGPGGAGKSSVLKLLFEMLGNYCKKLSFKEILHENEKTKKFIRNNLCVRFFNISEPDGGKHGYGFLKDLTSANNQFNFAEESFNAKSCFIFDSNFIFESKINDTGLKRRYHLVGFGRKGHKKIQNLDEVYKNLSWAVFLDLLVRFSHLKIRNLVEHPKITDEILEFYEYCQNPTKLCLDKCYAPNPRGKRISEREIAHFFYGEFKDYYDDFCKNNFFYDPYMSEGIWERLSSKKIYDEFRLIHHRTAVSGRQTIFYNLSLGIPGIYGTMRDKVVTDLKRQGLQDDEIPKVLKSSKSASEILLGEDSKVRDTRFMYSYCGPFSFRDCGLPYGATDEDWKEAVAKGLLNALNSFQFQWLSNFKNWLGSLMEKQRSEEFCRKLKAIAEKNDLNLNFCMNNSDFNNIFDEIFDSFFKWVKDDLQRKKQVSPTEPSLMLSPMNFGIPKKTLANWHNLPANQLFMFQQPFGFVPQMTIIPPVQQSAADNLDGSSKKKLILGGKN